LAMSSIMECIKELGYQGFTSLQKRVFNKVARENKSVLVIAPTGSGKTEAAIFPVFYRIRLDGLKPISAIYITPLRALNRDIERRIKRIASCFGLTVAVRHGDTPQSARRELAENPPHVLITTPESFIYMLVNEKIFPYIANVRYLIIDEFHEIVESKRGLLLLTILHLVEEYHGIKPLKIALSATLSNPASLSRMLSASDTIEVVQEEYAKQMEIRVAIPSGEGGSAQGLLEDERLEARLLYIINAARRHRGVLVFTNTRSLAEVLGSLLKMLAEKLGIDVSVGVHHGSLSRTHREDVESRFKQGDISILVATSSMELGIDIGHVDLVIQYLSPRQVSRLIQRVGRSGHKLGGVSRGVVLSTSNLLHMVESLVLVREALNGRLEREEVIPAPLDVLGYAIAVLAVITPSGVGKSSLFNTLRRHVLYSSLGSEEYEKLLGYMTYTRILRDENGVIKPTRKTKLYIYTTSMIPSTRDIIVTEASSGRKIGTLNEEYVVLNLKPDDVVILAGETWRIIGFDDEEGRLYVEKASVDYTNAIIPHWEGENIPVEASIALSVGEAISYVKKTGRLPPELEALLEDSVETDYEAVKDLAGHNEVFVDYVEDMNMVFINIDGGSKVNSLVRDLLRHLLRQRFPLVDFEAYSSPYAVVVRVKGHIHPSEILKAVSGFLMELGNYLVNRDLLRSVARGGQTLHWRIYQVAQRFGAVTPGETRVTRSMLDAFVDTVIGDEAFKEVLVKDYDIDSALLLASRIASGEVEVKARTYRTLSRHHLEILGYIELPIKREVMTMNISQYMERLLERELTLICIKCGFTRHGKVRELLEMEKYSCPRCGLATLTVVKGDAEEEKAVIDKLRKGLELKGEERRILDDLAKRAIVVYRFGKQALLAFAGRGVGTSEAIRILNNVSKGMDLVTEIYEREKAFLRVKRYIDAHR